MILFFLVEKDTKSNNIYVLGKDFIQGFSTDGGGHTIKKQKIYKTNFPQPNKMFVLSLHYNDDDSYLSVIKSVINHSD